MTTFISADNGTISGSAGYKATSDGSGVLALQTGANTTALTLSASQNATFAGTVSIPAGALITESMTLLGTLTTTSGTTQTLSGLDLTPYKFLLCWVDGVSFTATPALTFGGQAITSALATAATVNCGWINQNLASGVCVCLVEDIAATGNTNNAGASWYMARNGYINSTTSIQFAGGTFDAGTITVYGVK